MSHSSAGGPMRVAFVINGLTRGGAETQLLGVVRAAVARGHEVVIGTFNPGNDFTDQIAQLGVAVWEPEPGTRMWDPRQLLRLARELRAWRPDVTVTFLFQATLFMRLLNLLLRPQVRISSMRNERLESRLRSLLYRATCAADDLIVVNSHSARRTLESLRTVPRSEHVRVIYNGIDAELVRARVRRSRGDLRRSLGLSDEVVFLGVGRLQPQKNWGALLRAVALDGHGRSRFLIAGEGAEMDALEELARDLGIQDRVQFLGLRHDVPDLMAAADCMVLSSTYEGTPNVVLEALALDLPVISTDVGACSELLRRSGDVIVPVGDERALSVALSGFERSVAAGLQPADSGSRDASRHTSSIGDFSWSRIGDAWMDLIESGRSASGRSPVTTESTTSN